MSAKLTPSGNVAAPEISPATKSGQIVGFNLQNTGSTAIAAQPVSLNEVFQQGAVPQGSSLTVTIDGVVYQAQLDAKTFNPDGSVATGIVTFNAPQIPAGTTLSAMLGDVKSGPSAAPVDLATALDNYSLTAYLDITANQGGKTGTLDVNVAQAVKAALADGTAKMWLSGPLATEAIVSIPVTGSLRIEADITAYANGKISTTLQFNNDAAMQANGGTITYSAKVVQNGVTVDQQPSLTQYQYQDWSMTTGTTPSSVGLNIQHDIAYLEKLGVVPNYDLQYGVPGQNLTSEASSVAASGWGKPLATDGITQYMPMTGGRADIGPTTQGNATWLITQNGAAASFALGQAEGAGSVPWHFYDPTSNGSFLNTADYPDIWTDPRGGPSSYTTGLTQQVSANTGWQPDTAHMPDLNYVSYLLTGNVQDLEQLNAQASFAVTNFWPYPRGNGQAIVVSGGNQVRGSAWSLRTIQEAAYANPTGSAEKAYFTSVTNANYSYLVSMIPKLTAAEGQAYGYLPGAYGYNGVTLPPWEEDYFASTVIQGAEMGNSNALTFLKWESNFIVGRFFAENQGFAPQDGIAYNLAVGPHGPNAGNFSNGPYYKTWAEIETATQAASFGQSNISPNGTVTWAHATGDYGQLAMQSLAGIITVSVKNPTVMGNYQYEAMQAFGWLLNSGAPYTTPASIAASDTQFLIDPRLANGHRLSFTNMVLGKDAAGGATAITPIDSSANALLYAGAGADTLIGGGGINLLFGGAGNDVIFGGKNGNDIFAGAGNDTIIAGGGDTYIKASSTADLTAGTGKDLFVIDQGASGAVTVAGFNPGLDRLDVVGSDGTALSSAQISAIERTAVTVSGGVQYTISPNETLTITNETVPGANWFAEQNQAVTPSAALLAEAKANNTVPASTGSSSSNSSGGAPPPPQNPLTIITNGKAQTIVGGSGGSAVDTISGAAIDARRTNQQDSVTISGGQDTINALGGAGTFPTYGDVTMTGAGDQITVTGGVVTALGKGDSITSPYAFGYMVINEDGTGEFLKATKASQVSVGGSGNTAVLDIEAGQQGVPSATVGGASDTVTASVYSPILVTGAGDLINASGEAAVTVKGAANAAADTVTTSGFDAIRVMSGQAVVSVGGGGNVSTTIETDAKATSTAILGANANAFISGSGKVTVVDAVKTEGSATVSGFNPATDRISLQGANGQALTAAEVADILDTATVSGGTATLRLGSGATLTLTDLTSAPQAGWFDVTASAPPPPPPVTSDTLPGGYDKSFYDTVSGGSINAQLLGRTEFATIAGSNDTINAQGSAGGYASYGNITIAGQNDKIVDTGGVVMETGLGDTITSPYTFGFLDINEAGSREFVSANSYAQVTVGGSMNTAVLDLKSGGPGDIPAQVTGTHDTVTASVYTPMLLTGSEDLIKASGETAVTVAAAANSGADTIVATGFDAISTKSGDVVISVPGGSWNSTVTDISANDTIFAGAAAPGGGSGLAINGGLGSIVLNDMASGRTITMTEGQGAVTATGAANGSLIVGGSDGGNYLAASGNSTLVGNGASNTFAAGGGSEVMEASTVTGASNNFLFSKMAANDIVTINGFGAAGTRDSITLGSGVTIEHTTVTPGAGTLVALNDGSKILLNQFAGSLHNSTSNTGTVLSS